MKESTKLSRSDLDRGLNIFGVYKPKGMTSHDVVNIIRRKFGERRVGHAGTLDPLASGVLVVAVGRESTRQLNKFVQKEKEYLAKIMLGKTSTTQDEEGVKTSIKVTRVPIRLEVEKALSRFVGKIQQVPPIYSAVKVGGVRAYKRARKGQEVVLKAREVEIKKIVLVRFKYPVLEIRVVTGPGVYIRTLANDIGNILKTGGYLAELERTRVGEFTKEKAVKLTN
ncbi:MAG: tRNA pseudouridine(55) synthase TruB [Armatimonadetes bacterium]|nr:MAG: tRNA pseudouridine(55) synthase TruB [Armatimonadota bacterium]